MAAIVRTSERRAVEGLVHRINHAIRELSAKASYHGKGQWQVAVSRRSSTGGAGALVATLYKTGREPWRCATKKGEVACGTTRVEMLATLAKVAKLPVRHPYTQRTDLDMLANKAQQPGAVQRKLESLERAQARGKTEYAVVRGGEVVGVYSTKASALKHHKLGDRVVSRVGAANKIGHWTAYRAEKAAHWESVKERRQVMRKARTVVRQSKRAAAHAAKIEKNRARRAAKVAAGRVKRAPAAAGPVSGRGTIMAKRKLTAAQRRVALANLAKARAARKRNLRRNPAKGQKLTAEQRARALANLAAGRAAKKAGVVKAKPASARRKALLAEIIKRAVATAVAEAVGVTKATVAKRKPRRKAVRKAVAALPAPKASKPKTSRVSAGKKTAAKKSTVKRGDGRKSAAKSLWAAMTPAQKKARIAKMQAGRKKAAKAAGKSVKKATAKKASTKQVAAKANPARRRRVTRRYY